MLIDEAVAGIWAGRFARRPSWPEGVALGYKFWEQVVLYQADGSPVEGAVSYRKADPERTTAFETERYLHLIGSADGAERWADTAAPEDFRASDWAWCEAPKRKRVRRAA